MKGKTPDANTDLRSELKRISSELKKINEALTALNSAERFQQAGLEGQVKEVLAEVENLKARIPEDMASKARVVDFPMPRGCGCRVHINRALAALSLASDVSAIFLLAAMKVSERSGDGSVIQLAINSAIALCVFGIIVFIAYILRAEEKD